MTAQGPVTLRWNSGRPKPEEERFDDVDAALDAAVARWETLKDQAPQILDARRVLMLSTTEITEIAVEERAGGAAVGEAGQVG